MSDRTNQGGLASGSDLDARLKRVDEPRWLASRYAPAVHRTGLVVLFLVYNELARARLASEPMLGRIRLQWWREAVGELAGGGAPRRHDLVLALHERFKDAPQVLSATLKLIDSFDDAMDGGDTAGSSEAAEPAGPGEVMAEAVGRLLEEDISPAQLELLRMAGKLDERGTASLETESPDPKGLRRDLRKLKPILWPAIAHLAAYDPHGVQVGHFNARWRVFRTILTRKL